MDYLKEKVSYLKGLSDGLKIDEKTDEGKLLKGIIEVLGDFAEAMDELDDSQEYLNEYVEELDEDLADLEDEIYDEDYDEDDEEDELDGEYYEIECPVCHEIVVVEEEAFVDDSNKIICPNCSNEIEIDFECDGECDCGCHGEK